MTNRRESGT